MYRTTYPLIKDKEQEAVKYSVPNHLMSFIKLFMKGQQY